MDLIGAFFYLIIFFLLLFIAVYAGRTTYYIRDIRNILKIELNKPHKDVSHSQAE